MMALPRADSAPQRFGASRILVRGSLSETGLDLCLPGVVMRSGQYEKISPLAFLLVYFRLGSPLPLKCFHGWSRLQRLRLSKCEYHRFVVSAWPVQAFDDTACSG